MRPIFSLTALSSLALLIAAPLAAQSLRQQTGRDRADAPTQIISTNPFLPFWGNVQGEYERRLNARVSVAMAGSLMKFRDNQVDKVIDAKLRFYPRQRALEGLGIAVSVGLGFIRRDLSYYACAPLPGVDCEFPKGNLTAPTFATEVGYQWLLGPGQRIAMTTSGGVKRYVASVVDMAGDSRTRPMGRLSIGYAF